MPLTLGTVASATTEMFEPTDIAGLTAWYDASDASTFAYSSGTIVSQWNDKSGTGKHLTQSNVADQPDRSGSQNGLTSVKFAVDWMKAVTAADWTFLHDGTDHAIFIAFKIANTNTYGGVLGTLAAAGPPGPGRDIISYNAQRNLRDYLDNGGGLENLTADGVYQPGVWFVYSCLTDPDNGTAAARSSIKINGGTAITNNVGTGAPVTSAATTPLHIGARLSGDLTWLAAGSEIGEILIYNATLNESQRGTVNAYLMSKWFSASATFDPTTVTGLSQWYDANDASTFTYSSGVTVSQWSDKSGLGNHMTNGTVATQPDRTGTLNGRSIVSFATSDALDGASAQLPWDKTTQSLDVFVVAKRNNADGNYTHTWFTDNIGLNPYSGGWYSWVRQGVAYVFSSVASNQFWYASELQWLNSGDVATMWLDGVVATGPAANTILTGTNPHVCVLGSSNAVLIAEVLVYVTAAGISTTDRTNIRNYLSSKWFTP